jgi:hypothetical protein
MPVKSFVQHFRDEFRHHVEHKRCLVGLRAGMSVSVEPERRAA